MECTLKNGGQDNMTSLTDAEIEAIVTGCYEGIFSVLGLHATGTGKDLVARAFVPGAHRVEMIDREHQHTVVVLERIHNDGLFEGTLGSHRQAFDYLLRVNMADQQFDMEDPFRFPPCLSDDDLYLYAEGTQERTYQWMGAHAREIGGVSGVLFVVWAPTAKRVSVVGEFNDWDGRRHPMRKHPASGIWEIFIPAVANDAHYKYEIVDAMGKRLPLKADPYAHSMQHPPETASRVVLSDAFEWSDQAWMSQRSRQHTVNQPVSIYEVHAGSWRREAEQGNRYLSYRELADELIPYVLDLGFTHIQLMPISEYPFDGSWGYQPIGMYSPSIRFGTPDEFRYFVDCCHRHKLGVLLDWVPGHFPTDEHGLGRFDGTCLYEHVDVRKGFHPDWNTLIYNYGRGEVISYLVSNAHYWLDEFHIDGLRVDAVASMLYLDYSREDGQWIPNEQGGRENLEAIDLLKAVNSRVYQNYPGIMMIAEESTAWPGVSKPVDAGGLGFGYKWNMGWMNDTLRYMARDPIHRQYHHDEMTFGIAYAWSENYVLPLSHDEVVHGKGSLINKMPGDEWRQFANLRAYLAFMWAHPGKKLLFMGGEFAQRAEWNHDQGLDWHLLDHSRHRGMQSLVRDLNRAYRDMAALHQLDCEDAGFDWVQVDNARQSIFAWLRHSDDQQSTALVVANFTAQAHHHYQVGVPREGWYAERVNTDAGVYGGSDVGNLGGVQATQDACDGQDCSVSISLPPLATLIFELQADQ